MIVAQQLANALDDIHKKDAITSQLLFQLQEKDDAIEELTEKIIQIKSYIEIFTKKKNQQVEELQWQLEETEMQFEKLNEHLLSKEDQYQDFVIQVQEQLDQQYEELVQKDFEIQYWKDKSEMLEERLFKGQVCIDPIRS